jgi:hypothetical protein
VKRFPNGFLRNDETSAMEGVSIVWGAEILVTSGGLGAYYYSLMTLFDGRTECIEDGGCGLSVESRI